MRIQKIRIVFNNYIEFVPRWYKYNTKALFEAWFKWLFFEFKIEIWKK